MKTYNLIVIGGGSAGMASALEAYGNGIKDILILERENDLGGILLQCIHSGFGLEIFKHELTGPEYADLFKQEIIKKNIKYKLNTVVLSINDKKEIIYTNEEEGYVSIKAKAIILASGCQERNRGHILLPGDRPSGIMTAGLAQKYLNIDGYLVGKKVFILGSGDIGLIMARRMTLEGAKVLGVAELMPYSNGLNRNIVQCLKDYDIPLYLSHTVTNIYGKEHLERIEISKVDENLKPIKGTEMYFDCDTLLLSVGLVPSNELLASIGVKKNLATKGSFVNESLETSIDGIFSCGNSLHVHDLVDFVTKEARRAGQNASKYIKGELKNTTDEITVSYDKNIGYILPNVIHLANIDKNIVFNYRVRKPLKNIKINIYFNDTLIKTLKKPYMLPAEMEELVLNKELFNSTVGNIRVEIEETL